METSWNPTAYKPRPTTVHLALPPPLALPMYLVYFVKVTGSYSVG